MAVRSVLVVDDDSGMAETLADILSIFGYAVTTANSAAAAVKVVTETRPDLVLMDVRMPGPSGVEALKTLKALAPQVAVIMMTAFARENLAEEARRRVCPASPRLFHRSQNLIALGRGRGAHEHALEQFRMRR